MINRLLLGLLLVCAIGASAQTTINVSSTVQKSGIFKPGYVIGNVGCYGSKQMLKDLNYCNFGYLNPIEYSTSYYASSGGTQTLTSFYSSIFDATGYPANFWQGATYYVISGQTGLGQLGTGTISTQTQNQTAGPTFTWTTPLSSVPTSSGNTNADTLIVNCRSVTQCPNIMPAPSSLINCSGTCVWSSDLSPFSQNTTHSLQVTNGTITFTLDALNGQPQNTVSTAQVNALNLNGNYTETHQDHCVGSCTITFALKRGSTTFVSGTESPASWVKDTTNFTGFENGSQNAQLLLTYSCSGTCNFADMTVIEGTSIGNTTPFRDDIVLALQKAKVNELRDMGTANWGSDVTSILQPYGAEQGTAPNPTKMTTWTMPIPYPDMLALGLYLNASVVLDIGKSNTGSDYAILASYLGSACGATGSNIRCNAGITTPWNTTYGNAGLQIMPEIVNEPWNGNAGGQIDAGNGVGYGWWMGQINTAFKAAAGYSATVNPTISSGWASAGQANGAFGWTQNSMNAAGCTNGTQTSCPYYIQYAFYLLGNLNDLTDPFTDEVAEIVNQDTVGASGQPQSAKLAQTYAATFGLHTMVYESSFGLSGGTAAPTQAQMNGISNSIITGYIMSEHWALMLRDSLIYGPINNFALQDEIAIGGSGGTQQTAWQDSQYFAAGPGQTWTDAYRPKFLFQAVMNQAIGSNLNLIQCTQTGTPTFNYPGGQGGQVVANAAVPYVNALCTTDGAGHYSVLVWNNNETTAESITLTGNTPVGTVTQTMIGNLNALTDNCANGTINNNATPCAVVMPTSQALAATNTWSVPAHTLMTLVYGTAGVNGSRGGFRFTY